MLASSLLETFGDSHLWSKILSDLPSCGVWSSKAPSFHPAYPGHVVRLRDSQTPVTPAGVLSRDASQGCSPALVNCLLSMSCAVISTAETEMLNSPHSWDLNFLVKSFSCPNPPPPPMLNLDELTEDDTDFLGFQRLVFTCISFCPHSPGRSGFSGPLPRLGS